MHCTLIMHSTLNDTVSIKLCTLPEMIQSTLNDTVYIKPCIQHQMIRSTSNDTVYITWYNLH